MSEDDEEIALRREHGGDHYDALCEICQALALLDAARAERDAAYARGIEAAAALLERAVEDHDPRFASVSFTARAIRAIRSPAVEEKATTCPHGYARGSSSCEVCYEPEADYRVWKARALAAEEKAASALPKVWQGFAVYGPDGAVLMETVAGERQGAIFMAERMNQEAWPALDAQGFRCRSIELVPDRIGRP